MSIKIQDWTSPPPVPPAGLRLDHLLAHRAALSPESVAYICGDESLRYRELDGFANTIAHQLRDQGLGPEVVVAVMMNRALELPIAIFAVLKAGGAVMYLDPDEPPERRAALLRQVAARVLLTTGVPDIAAGCPVFDISALRGSGVITPVAPGTESVGANLAQLLQTSGSTGVPKVVMRTHRMLAGQLLFEQSAFGLTASDRHLFKFPASFRESLLPSLAGGAAVIAEPGGQRDSGYLVRLIREKQISVVSFVPSALKSLLNEPDLPACESLRHVSCGGELMSPETEKRFHRQLRAKLHITYTMTEADYVSSWESTPDHRHAPGWLGHETNMQVYLVDESFQQVGTGQVGEIVVSGPALARGYLNDPVTTSARFVANPFGPPGSRLYRTGDLGLRLPDGGIAHAGRMDDQVKIGGRRIDLGEIDTALLSLPGIKDAAVTAWISPFGDIRLIAHLVEGTAPASHFDIRNRLARELPTYMVPSLFCWHTHLPRLPNGKLDRKALPSPERKRPVLASNYVAPTSPTERWVVDIWTEALWIAEVGTEDNFFDLGGTSLLLMQVRSRLNLETRSPIAISDVLTHPTAGALAAWIDRLGIAPGAGEVGARPAVVTDQPAGMPQRRQRIVSGRGRPSAVVDRPDE